MGDTKTKAKGIHERHKGKDKRNKGNTEMKRWTWETLLQIDRPVEEGEPLPEIATHSAWNTPKSRSLWYCVIPLLPLSILLKSTSCSISLHSSGLPYSTYLYLDLHWLTKLKEHSREICYPHSDSPSLRTNRRPPSPTQVLLYSSPFIKLTIRFFAQKWCIHGFWTCLFVSIVLSQNSEGPMTKDTFYIACTLIQVWSHHAFHIGHVCGRGIGEL